ncbi:MAG: Hcp family type VI secretion system effector [Gaiellaceae bacterium]
MRVGSQSISRGRMAVDYFLKIDGIEGESQDAGHKGEIDVEAWSWGETQAHPAGVGGGGGAGKVSMSDFSFTTRLSKASPTLFLTCASGAHIKAAWLTGQRGGGKHSDYFLKWTFSDLLISSYQAGAAEDVPVDNVSFSFAKIEVEYKQLKADGTLGGSFKAGWDLKKNQKI